MPFPVLAPAILGTVLGSMWGAKKNQEIKNKEEALKRIRPIMEKAVEAGNVDAISQNRDSLREMGLSDTEINIYDQLARGNQPKSPEELRNIIGSVIGGISQAQGGQEPQNVLSTPQAQEQLPLDPYRNVMPPPYAQPDITGGVNPETIQPIPSKVSAQPQQARVPVRPRPTDYAVTEADITPQGNVKGMKVGRTTATEREAETAREISRLMDKENMSLRDAMENARGRGFTMDNAAWVQFGQRAYRQTFNKRFQELGGKPTDRLLAAVLAEQEVGSEYADPTQRKTLDELRDNPASDPQIGNMVSKIIELVGNGAMKETDAEAAVMRITGGKSLEKLGVRLPGARERVFAQQSPERQAQLLEPPVIVQTPEGPQAVRPLSGMPPVKLPKPPLPDKILDAYAAANTVITVLDDLTNKYDAMVRATGNRLSGKLRQSLAANTRYQTLNNFTNVTGATPEENEFAGAYNALMGQLKKFNNVPGSFSDREAVFALQTIGNAARGYGNFHAQQRATKKNAAVAFNQTLSAALAGGRYDAGNVRVIDPNLGQSATVGGVEGVWAGDWAEAAQIAPPKGFGRGWVTRDQFKTMPR